jgi:hypothetical protein
MAWRPSGAGPFSFVALVAVPIFHHEKKLRENLWTQMAALMFANSSLQN